MNRLVTPEEEDFLDFLIKTYYRENKSHLNSIFNFNVIQQAMDSFLSYFKNEDKLKQSNHSDIIKTIFIEDMKNLKCLPKLGISKTTFYRYKQKYLLVFKNYLYQSIENNPQEQLK